jgi:hypothetical protein
LAATLGEEGGEGHGGMEVPQMVRMALSELIQAAMMAAPAAAMVYRGLWRRGYGKEAKQVSVWVWQC